MTCRYLSVALCLLMLGCSSTDESEPGDTPTGEWVGELSDGETWIAVSFDGDMTVAYVCGGDATRATHTRWMSGTQDGAAVSLTRDGWMLSTTLEDGDITGTLTDPDGVASSFSASHPGEPDPAGLFTAVDSGCRDGVIVSSSGSSQGAWCDSLDNFGEVTPATPIDNSGFDVVATTPGGDRQFFVEPVVPGQLQL